MNHPPTEKIPSSLLEAISNPPRGRVALIVGAGCSLESPTCLPLSSDCSEDAYHKLIANNVLAEGDCVEPKDLSLLADVVYAKRNAEQKELVHCLPVTRFRNAEANDGYLIAAALLVERAVGNALTLNYDHAFQNALANVGARDEVAVVYGPDDHGHVGECNLIYLHRNAGADPETWILRTEQLEQAWRNSWEEIITSRIAGTPHLIFAGLGYPAAVLVETIRRVRQALKDQVSIYYVDPSEFESSKIAMALSLKKEQHIKMKWGEFMSHLADRVVLEQVNKLRRACADLVRANNIASEDCEQVLGRMRNLGLLKLGKLRAAWQLEQSQYASDRQNESSSYADIVLAIALLERMGTAKSEIGPEGNVALVREGRCLCTIVPIAGKGTRTVASVEPIVRQKMKELDNLLVHKPVLFLLAGVEGAHEEITLPESIVSGSNPENIAVRIEPLPWYRVPDVRKDPSIILGNIQHA